MKVERTQLPLASASKQISQFAAARRVDAAPGSTEEDAKKRGKKHSEDEEDETTSPASPLARGEEARMLNITA
jgi:hypothetical protein